MIRLIQLTTVVLRTNKYYVIPLGLAYLPGHAQFLSERTSDFSDPREESIFLLIFLVYSWELGRLGRKKVQ